MRGSGIVQKRGQPFEVIKHAVAMLAPRRPHHPGAPPPMPTASSAKGIDFSMSARRSRLLAFGNLLLRRLLYDGVFRSVAANTHFPDAVVPGWAGWSAEGDPRLHPVLRLTGLTRPTFGQASALADRLERAGGRLGGGQFAGCLKCKQSGEPPPAVSTEQRM